MSAFLSTDGLVALVTLTAMEIVLGIDNIVFISILTAKLPPAQQERRAGSASAWRCSSASGCCSRSPG